MSKRNVVATLTFVLVLSLSSIAMAEDGGAKAAGLWSIFGIAIAAGLAIGIAALGTGLGMGNAINGALTGVARNPEAGGRILTMMIVGLGLIESLAIYAFLIAILLVLKFPALDTMLEAIVKGFGA
jgi:F-type H+-transporting ATPase subunit c